MPTDAMINVVAIRHFLSEELSKILEAYHEESFDRSRWNTYTKDARALYTLETLLLAKELPNKAYVDYELNIQPGESITLDVSIDNYFTGGETLTANLTSSNQEDLFSIQQLEWKNGKNAGNIPGLSSIHDCQITQAGDGIFRVRIGYWIPQQYTDAVFNISTSNPVGNPHVLWKTSREDQQFDIGCPSGAMFVQGPQHIKARIEQMFHCLTAKVDNCSGFKVELSEDVVLPCVP